MCVKCGGKTWVVNTDQLVKNVTNRRLCCHACKHRFNSLELPEVVVRAMGVGRVFGFARRAMKVMRAGIARAQRRQTVEQLLAEGWKVAAIAHEVGLTEARVRQIRAEIAQGEKA